ncbi:hypothetical protein FKM82_014218 [Ascaphus truei]
MLSINHLPGDALLDVLSLVPARDLIQRCQSVCSLWRDIIDSPTHWKKKCQLEGLVSKHSKRKPCDWKMFYLVSKLKRNLLKNPCAEEKFTFWRIDKSCGDGWKIDDLPGTFGQPFADEKAKKYFVTSYGSCKKSQLIVLKKEGYSNELMDVIQPDIVVRDWYAARHDCGCKYKVRVQLLSEDNIVLDEFFPKPTFIKQWSDAKWTQVLHKYLRTCQRPQSTTAYHILLLLHR